ncbi:MAG: hypothetical protein GEU75_15425 [Dehalococcoidia bacterium]|nr:hypothetical protein [Dehalococcoidia bacterium]
MFKSRGLRISTIGAGIFLLSLVGLVFLPNLVPMLAMMVGGVMVWLGFIMTIFGYYSASPPP